MKKLITILVCMYSLNTIQAQPVAKAVIAEHFTNTYCSICASKNPVFYDNYKNFPQVLHIAYHPSSPYPACPLNQHNKTENDARTNFYGIYGSTPRVVIQGTEVTTAYTDPAIFQNALGQTTAFELTTIIKDLNSTTIEVRVVVRKKDASSLINIMLYTSIVEDTLFFVANNGENKHYDVFRKSVWGSQPLSLTAPTNIGDSVVQTQQITLSTVWNKNRVYAISILQDASKNAIQAAKSNHLPSATSIGGIKSDNNIRIYPNPSNDFIKLECKTAISMVTISDINGRELKSFSKIDANSVDIAQLPKGTYILSIKTANEVLYARFVKN